MLVPVTFKNNDTETIKTKIGKVSQQKARLIYCNALAKQVGIIENYKNTSGAESCSIINPNNISKSQDGTKFIVKFNKGAVSIYGGIGVIEQGTEFEVANVNTSKGSLGIRVDLSKSAGEEMVFYAKTTALDKDNLLVDEQGGAYDLELYTYSITNGSMVLTKSNTPVIKNFDDIHEKVEYVYANIDNLKKSPKILFNSTLSTGSSASWEDDDLINYNMVVVDLQHELSNGTPFHYTQAVPVGIFNSLDNLVLYYAISGGYASVKLTRKSITNFANAGDGSNLKKIGVYVF